MSTPITKRAEVAQRRTRAVQLRRDGRSWQAIADELGYSGPAAACKDVARALQAALKAEQMEAAQLRELELQHLDRLREAAMRVLDGKHLTVQAGKVVKVRGKPLEDDSPRLAAIDRLVKIATRRASLLGLDAPAKVDLTGVVRYEIVGIDPDELT